MNIRKELLYKCTAIYTVTCKITGGIYIGLTYTPANRWKQHYREAKAGKRTPFYNALRKHGVFNFDWKIESWHKNRYLANDAEILKIKTLRDEGYTVYNISDGGGQLDFSPETRLKMSFAQKGKKQSAATIKKRSVSISKTLKGHEVSIATRDKISDSLKARFVKLFPGKIPRKKWKKVYGPKPQRIVSQETRTKLSRGRLGKQLTEEQSLRRKEVLGTLQHRQTLSAAHLEDSRRRIGQKANPQAIGNMQKAQQDRRRHSDLVLWFCSQLCGNKITIQRDRSRSIDCEDDILSIPLPFSSETPYYYRKFAGLSLIVYPSGSKTWTLCKKIKGKNRIRTLGHYPEMTLLQAIEQAKLALPELVT